MDAVKLLIASRYMQLINHIIEEQTPDKTFRAYCGADFLLTDGLLDESDSVQVARLCDHCLHRMKVLNLPVPGALPTGWRENPYDLA